MSDQDLKGSERSVDELLDLTIEVIAEEGLAKCSFRVLAERAGTSTSIFTYRFKDRVTLIRRVLERAYDIGWEDMALGDLEHPDPIQRLYEIGLDDLQLGQELDAYKRAYAEILVAAPREPELVAALRESDGPFLASYRSLIRRAQDEGQLDPELDPYSLSLAIWAVIDGLNINRYAYGNELGPEVIETFFRRAFEGIVGRPIVG